MVALTPKDFIEDYERWPLYPILPMEHKRQFDAGIPKLGVMIACDGYELTVFHCNLYDLRKVRDVLAYSRETYNSLAELKNDWLVS